jgi:hypothetical protein
VPRHLPEVSTDSCSSLWSQDSRADNEHTADVLPPWQLKGVNGDFGDSEPRNRRR